eukprot:TRINITY_DN56345_c0_g1_i1.p1 TRINITY_DN56345_c0_g1~~TRINITY_DN56345_c0_g1_i1.p1  ORF type:complete len:327 (+),score=32.14 TRINITY_DN56345_c0_g1_i1:3-983(+)
MIIGAVRCFFYRAFQDTDLPAFECVCDIVEALTCPKSSDDRFFKTLGAQMCTTDLAGWPTKQVFDLVASARLFREKLQSFSVTDSNGRIFAYCEIRERAEKVKKLCEEKCTTSKCDSRKQKYEDLFHRMCTNHESSLVGYLQGMEAFMKRQSSAIKAHNLREDGFLDEDLWFGKAKKHGFEKKCALSRWYIEGLQSKEGATAEKENSPGSSRSDSRGARSTSSEGGSSSKSDAGSHGRSRSPSQGKRDDRTPRQGSAASSSSGSGYRSRGEGSPERNRSPSQGDAASTSSESGYRSGGQGSRSREGSRDRSRSSSAHRAPNRTRAQ